MGQVFLGVGICVQSYSEQRSALISANKALVLGLPQTLWGSSHGAARTRARESGNKARTFEQND